MITLFKGKQLWYEVQFESYPEDSFISYAAYVGSDAVLTDEEYDELNAQEAARIGDAWLEHQVGRAEARNDAKEER